MSLGSIRVHVTWSEIVLISLKSFLLLDAVSIFESLTPISTSFGTFDSSIETPAITSGPSTEPLPASSTPATINLKRHHSLAPLPFSLRAGQAFPRRRAHGPHPCCQNS